MNWIDIFRHLLPRARAWKITIDRRLRQFFLGYSSIGEDVKKYADDIWLDIFPDTTREIKEWEEQFGLPETNLTEAQRRARLDATWKAQGAQDPLYIQETLHNNGFTNLFVYEWWEPGTQQPVNTPGAPGTVRNPLNYLRRQYTGAEFIVGCGELEAQCGEAFAQCGNSDQPRGYPLVNKIFVTEPDIIPLAGEASAECGESSALCGNYTDFVDRVKSYTVPWDEQYWPYFIYIGGGTFGKMQTIDPKRRDELESILLQIGPTHVWIGMLVEYS